MSKKLPEGKVKLIKKLYNEDIPIREVAKKIGVSYSTVWAFTRGEEKGFNSRKEYEDYQVRQRINPETGEKYKSLGKLQDYLARQRSKKKKNKTLSSFIKK